MKCFTRWCVFAMLALAYAGCTDDEEQRATPVVGPSMQVVGAGSGNLDWTCDLTSYDNSCTLIDGTYFYQGSGPTSAGTGVFGPIVRIATNNPVERGYNTSARPVQFDENTDPNHTVSLPLNALPVIEVGGELYREFNLDINQSGSVPGLSLDEIYIYLSTDSLINSATVRACDFGHPGTTELTWALDGDMDDGSGTEIDCLAQPFEDQWVLLNYRLEGGSGNQDMTMWVPDAFFESTLAAGVGGIDQCPYDGGRERCGLWVYFYSHFGGAVEPVGTEINWPPVGGKDPATNSAPDLTTVINNANFEEWNYVRRPFVLVEKTAVPTFDRRHLWDIDKTVNGVKEAFCSVFPGEDCPEDFDYEVEASYEGFEDYNATVAGVITITNPEQVKEGGKVTLAGSTGPVQVTGVEDFIVGIGEVDVTLECTPAIGSILDVGDVMTCDYSAVMDGYLPPTGENLTNRVEVSIYDPEAELGLGGGAAEAKFAYSATADPDDNEAVEPGSEESCLVDPAEGEDPYCTPGDQITLSDDFATPGDISDDLPATCGDGVTCNTDDWTAVAPNTAIFTYSRAFSCSAEDINVTYEFENTAVINELDRSSSAKVTVDCLKFGSKAGTKFHDLNANGVQDEGEGGLSGWEITLTGTDDLGQPVNRTTTTDENGDYLFDLLRPSDGNYTVTETLQSGWTCSFPNPGTPDAVTGAVTSDNCSYSFAVTTDGEDHTDNDFGNWTTATKSGMKFHDLNANGAKDGGEGGLGGWVIYVDYDGDDTKDAAEPSATTAADGTYQITGIVPGTWDVREVAQTGWNCSFPGGVGSPAVSPDADCEHTDLFQSGAAVTGNDFGNWTTATKEGVKFEDLDADGAAREAGEPGLGGWKIYVDYNGNDQWDEGEPFDVTASDGSYKIEGINPGTYGVREVPQTDWTCSYPAGCEHNETFKSGDALTGNDFGNWTTATKEGVKFEDLDADGAAREAGEPGLGGWKIYVDYNGNDQWDEGEPFDVTASDGSYKIEGINPGTYGVREVPQTDWTCSYPAGCEHNETFKSRDALTDNDFGNWTYATKSGTKYLDNDGDGGFDSPLGGYTIYVDYNDNGQPDGGEPSDVTAADGTYLITGIVPGTWKVREVQQNLWVCTFPTNSDFLGDCYHQDTFDSGENETGNNFANHPPQPETAWAANGREPGQLPFNPTGGNWATYVDTWSGDRFADELPDDQFCTNLYESQDNLAGEVCFTRLNGTVQIDITLTGGYIFQPGGAIKIQDYATAPIGESSAPGQFQYSGEVLTDQTGTATVPLANFYAVHALVIDMGF